MMKKSKLSLVLSGLAVLALVLFVAGCADKGGRKAMGEMDNPAHHTQVGQKRIMEGMQEIETPVATENDDVDTLRHAEETSHDRARKKFDLAIESFTRAVELDDKWSPAYSGMAVADAYLASLKTDKDAKAKKSADAEANLEKAKNNLDDNREWKIVYHTDYIRVLTLLKWKDWLDEAKENYDDAKDLLKEGEKNYALEYFMGNAYAAAYQFDTAESYYNRAFVKDSPYEKLAGEKKAKIGLIRMANPQTDAAKRIAMKDFITRADAAALFVEELQIQKYLARAAKRAQQPEWKARNVDYKAPKMVEDTRDIAGHPLEQDIRELLSLGLTGLEETAAHKFYPDKPVARGEFAMMVTELLARGTLNPKLETQFIGSEEFKFPDLRNDTPVFNAAVVVTSRGLMQPFDVGTNAFGPKKAVSGARALVTVSKLRQVLESF